MALPDNMLMSFCLPFLIPILVGGAIFAFIIYQLFKSLQQMDIVDKKLKDGSGEAELLDTVSRRISEKGLSNIDFFSPSYSLYAGGPSQMDLFIQGDIAPVAATERLFTVNLSQLRGVYVTKTKQDTIKTKIDGDTIAVYLNGLQIGSLDMAGKKVLDANGSEIGTLEFPDWLVKASTQLGSISINTVNDMLFDMSFNGVKVCSVVMARAAILPASPTSEIARFFERPPSKEQKALALGLIMFVRTKQLFQGSSTSSHPSRATSATSHPIHHFRSHRF